MCKQAILPGTKAVVGFSDYANVSGVKQRFQSCNEKGGTDGIGRPGTHDEGSGTGDRSVRILHVEQIADDFRKQSADIELIRRRFKADSSVVHPAHPFVALRTVGQDSVKI